MTKWTMFSYLHFQRSLEKAVYPKLKELGAKEATR